MTSGGELWIETEVNEKNQIVLTFSLNLPEEGYSLELLEQEAVQEVLRRCNGNKSKAAVFLRIPRHTLLYRLEKYNIRTF
ncbi:MAG: hypothetical protein BA864_03675 [Desulfuromonadales bacterium C00003093]|nr:MAG: hypothetical protein BA864_03675 [Desulfuromonadales bacterium C00003093]